MHVTNFVRTGIPPFGPECDLSWTLYVGSAPSGSRIPRSVARPAPRCGNMAGHVARRRRPRGGFRRRRRSGCEGDLRALRPPDPDGGHGRARAGATWPTRWCRPPCSRRGGRPGRSTATRDLAPWIYAIARRVAIDIHRREARAAVPTEIGDELTVDPLSFSRTWEAWEVRSAVEKLPADERAVVRLAHLGGLTHREIADELGCPSARSSPARRGPTGGWPRSSVTWSGSRSENRTAAAAVLGGGDSPTTCR